LQQEVERHAVAVGLATVVPLDAQDATAGLTDPQVAVTLVVRAERRKQDVCDIPIIGVDQLRQGDVGPDALT